MSVILKMCILIGLLFMYFFIISSHFFKETTIKRHTAFSEGVTSINQEDEDEDEDKNT